MSRPRKIWQLKNTPKTIGRQARKNFFGDAKMKKVKKGLAK